MRYIPLAFFSSQAPGPLVPEECFCDTATFTLTPTSPFTGVSRLVSGTFCDGSSINTCYSRGGTTPRTFTLLIEKGSTIGFSNTGGCPAGNGTVSSVTYDRNYCPTQYPDGLNFNIQSCQNSTVYSVRVQDPIASNVQTGRVYNFTDINSLSSGLIPNGCYSIVGFTTNASQLGVNFIRPQDYATYSSCNECISSL